MKKFFALVILATVALAASQPAIAGVGGCSGRIGVGGCWNLETNTPEVRTPSVLESLRGAMPADVFEFLRVMFERNSDGPVLTPSEPTTEGVGGCTPRAGVGGCWL